MPKFQMAVLVKTDALDTARVSDGAAGVSASQLDKLDAGKFVKLTADSQYGMCAVGNEIEGFLVSANDVAPNDGFNLGAVQKEGRVKVTLDGLQATPGVGVIAVGDYVVAGSVTARGTVLPGPVKVCKATAAATGLIFKWRVVALLGTTAVGQLAYIEYVS